MGVFCSVVVLYYVVVVVLVIFVGYVNFGVVVFCYYLGNGF